MDIKGSKAFVTGANRGIGRVFVEELIKAGADKVYAAARVKDSLIELSQAYGHQVIPIALNVTDLSAVNRAAEMAPDTDLLINNAGVANFEGFLTSADLEAARQEMNTNYYGSLQMVRAFAPILKSNDGGAIIQISSIAGMVTFPVVGSYSASKAAVNAMIKGVRAELAAQGTLVTGVYPGVVDTEMSARFDGQGVPPVQIVCAALEAVMKGDEEVFPDAMSNDLYASVRRDPKTVERQFAEMLPASGD